MFKFKDGKKDNLCLLKVSKQHNNLRWLSDVLARSFSGIRGGIKTEF